MIYKERKNKWHEKKIREKSFKEGNEVRKLKSRWSGPFRILKVFTNPHVELISKDCRLFKANGHRLKQYDRVEQCFLTKNLGLKDPE